MLLASVRFGLGGRERDAGLRVILDLDDTLMPTQPRFDRATERSAGLIAETLGVPAAESTELFVAIDREAVLTGHRFWKDRFRDSWQAAAARVAARRGMAVPGTLLAELAAVADAIWEPPYTAYPSTVRVLAELAALPGVGHIDVLTLGDPDIQRAKLSCLPAEASRHLRQALVVNRKDAAAYREMLGNDRPESCVMVGNSMRSDVEPALAAGLWAVHVDHHSWSLDAESAADVSSPRFRRVRDLPDVPGAVARIIEEAAR